MNVDFPHEPDDEVKGFSGQQIFPEPKDPDQLRNVLRPETHTAVLAGCYLIEEEDEVCQESTFRAEIRICAEAGFK